MYSVYKLFNYVETIYLNCIILYDVLYTWYTVHNQGNFELTFYTQIGSRGNNQRVVEIGLTEFHCSSWKLPITLIKLKR